MFGLWYHFGWCWLLALAHASWVEEFLRRYQAQGHWTCRTREYDVHRPTQVGRVFVYRAFDIWSQNGPFYRATVATHQMMLPDELLWRIALHWPDLGNNWNQVGWRLVSVDDSRSTSCLSDLLHPTYVLIMPELLSDLSHRPHRLLEVTHGDTCHVRGTVLPPQINLSILQELLQSFCRREWPMVRCIGTHNRVALTFFFVFLLGAAWVKSRANALQSAIHWWQAKSRGQAVSTMQKRNKQIQKQISGSNKFRIWGREDETDARAVRSNSLARSIE